MSATHEHVIAKDLRSWIETPAGSDFPLQNIPFGIFRAPGRTPRACTRIGDTVVDLQVLAEAGMLAASGINKEAFHQATLNPMLAFGKAGVRRLRTTLCALL
ncbi:MAG: fumarylacetoacetase, partial [Bacteroidetes bacterium]|nr:fumarylacetoacetase [Bacteroidota bacterium]